jgi:hypothetical protein
MDTIRDMIAAQRAELAEVLAGLPAPSWDEPTLCAGWRVREVVAHITMPFRFSGRRFALELAKSRGRFNEMADRVEGLLGSRIAKGMWILTFHSACGRILRREAERLGYRSNFTIYDQADQVRVVKDALAELDRDPKRFVPRGIHSQISNAKNQLIGPDEYASRVASFYDQTVADVYSLYQRKLFGSNAVDFDDMLMLTVDVLQRFPEARRTRPRTGQASFSQPVAEPVGAVLDVDAVDQELHLAQRLRRGIGMS